MTLEFLGFDDWSRPVYKDNDGRLWKDVDPRRDRAADLCTCINNEFYGEPDTNMRYIPQYENAEIVFFPDRMTW